MARMMGHARQAFDQRRHAGQRPHVGAEPVGRGPRPQAALDRRPLLGLEPRLAASSPGGPETRPPIGLPGLMPVVGGRGRHAQRPGHRGLRLALGKQLRRLQPPSFQRSKIPAGPAAGGGHGLA